MLVTVSAKARMPRTDCERPAAAASRPCESLQEQAAAQFIMLALHAAAPAPRAPAAPPPATAQVHAHARTEQSTVACCQSHVHTCSVCARVRVRSVSTWDAAEAAVVAVRVVELVGHRDQAISMAKRNGCLISQCTAAEHATAEDDALPSSPPHQQTHPALIAVCSERTYGAA